MKKDVQESQNKKDYDLNIIENKCLSKYFKTSAKVCRAEAWTFVCRELSSKLYKRSIIPFNHQTTSLGRLRPVSSLLGLISQS